MSQATAKHQGLGAELHLALRSLLRRCLWLDRAGCCGFPLSPVQYQVLEALARGPLSMQTLSQRLSVAPSTATRLVEPLARSKWLERKPSPADRRVWMLSLRPEGEALRDQIQKISLGWIEALLEAVPERRRPSVVRALKDLAQASATLDQSCCVPSSQPKRFAEVKP
jgi:DNA-binding MarR family transcriptional regulator